MPYPNPGLSGDHWSALETWYEIREDDGTTHLSVDSRDHANRMLVHLRASTAVTLSLVRVTCELLEEPA